MKSTVSSRGRITINSAIRKQLGIQPGMVAYQRVVGNHLEIAFLPAPHYRSLFGVLHREGEKPHVTTSDELEKAVMEAIAAEQEDAGIMYP